MQSAEYSAKLKLSNKARKNLEFFELFSSQLNDLGQLKTNEVEAYKVALIHDQVDLHEDVNQLNDLSMMIAFIDGKDDESHVAQGWQVYKEKILADGSRFNSMPLRGGDLLAIVPSLDHQKHIGSVLEALRKSFVNRNWDKKIQGMELAKSIFAKI